jgi:hypothetical protein
MEEIEKFEVLFIAGFGPIVREAVANRKLYDRRKPGLHPAPAFLSRVIGLSFFLHPWRNPDQASIWRKETSGNLTRSGTALLADAQLLVCRQERSRKLGSQTAPFCVAVNERLSLYSVFKARPG